MAAPFYDPTLKALVETEPIAWPRFLSYPVGATTVIDADIATVSGAADKVLRVAAISPYLLHVEFVAGHDSASLPAKLVVRNTLLTQRHDLRVRSAVILLAPGSDSPQLTGRLECSFPDEEPYLTFRYQVIRVWQLQPEPLLSGSVSLLPLAPICDVTASELPGIIKEMEKRLTGRRQAEVVWSATYILLGLRHSRAIATELLRGVRSMKESTTYQAILEEGRSEGRSEGAVTEARKLLRLLGDDAFGVPDARTAAQIERLNDLERLELLLKRARSATSWKDLLRKSGRGENTRSRG